MIRFFILTILSSCYFLFGVDFRDFEAYQNVCSFEEVSRKITQFLEKDPAIRSFYHLTPDALYLGDLEKGQLDFVLHLATTSLHLKSEKRHGLQGVKVAIDPGHFEAPTPRLRSVL